MTFKELVDIMLLIGRKKMKETTVLECSNCNNLSSLTPTSIFFENADSKVSLCSSCIEVFYSAYKQIWDSKNTQNLITKGDLPTPKEILQKIEEHVVRQDEAKKTIAIAVAHHYRRLRDPSIGKSNVLVIGPTGTGKTEIARSIAKFLNVPFASVDASSFTAKGYIGEDPDSMLRNLLISANFNVDQAETGIIFIDEIDKLAQKGNQESGIGTTAVQQQLLTLLEGNKVQIKVPTPDGGEAFAIIDTSKILFICSGAFVGLEDIVKKGESKLRPLGFHSMTEKKELKPEETYLRQVDATHLAKFGIIPELLGRLPVLTYTLPLSKDDLVRILKEPKESLLKKYKRLFELDSVTLELSDSFLESVAKEAQDKNLGARGLRSVFEGRLKEHFLNIHELKGRTLSL